MKMLIQTFMKITASCLSALPIIFLFGLGNPGIVNADEAYVKKRLKTMSEYMISQKEISFEYDAILEVVTTEGQKLGMASSGSAVLNRPDKIRVTHTGGFADVELFFDGKTLTLLGKNLNIYSQLEIAGTIDHLINELKDTYKRPLPAADLLLSDSYDEMMLDVVDVKDLGSGVIGGVECDHFAFRKKDVDWQIWIATGETPYPARYVITTTSMDGDPQYSIQTRNWKSGTKVAATDFQYTNSSGAEEVDLKELKGTDDFPQHFTIEGAK